MQAVVIVKSPLQYVNALEACSHFNLFLSESLLIIMADKKSRAQLDKMAANQNEWGRVERLHEIAAFGFWKNKIFNTSKLNNLFQDMSAKYLMLGDCDNALMRHASHVLSYDKLVALDDGTKILHSYDMRSKDIDVLRATRQKKNKLILKSTLLGLRGEPIPPATFFSNFELDTIANDNYIKNDYQFLQNRIKAVERSNETYFIGGALVEAGEFTEEEYLAQLGKVNERLARENVLYVAHRRESKTKLEKISQYLGWQVVLFDFPIEYQLAIIGPVPRKLASFTSTALLNCDILFGDVIEVVSYRFSDSFFDAKDTDKGKRLLGIYKYFEENVNAKFEIVDL